MTRVAELGAEVEEQLVEIASWYQRQSGSEEVAQRWYDGFVEAIQALEVEAERHLLATESDDFPFELRALFYGSGRRKTHRALFRILDDVVEVLAVRHLAQQALRPDDL